MAIFHPRAAGWPSCLRPVRTRRLRSALWRALRGRQQPARHGVGALRLAGRRSASLACASRQRGFSLIEVSIVTAIVLIIAIVGLPAINNYVIENKVPRVGEELQRFIARTKANAQGGGSLPYAAMGPASLAGALRNSGVITVEGTGAAARVAHGLGGNGVTTGLLTVAPVGAGAGFSLTLDAVHDAACPGLASVLHRMVVGIGVGSGTSAVTANSALKQGTQYSAMATEAACQAVSGSGDKNTFTFYVDAGGPT